ncbi:ABC transporter permease [Brevibacterium casei]|uniref:ABC transporter permease n=1 Tax=Brevibacterium casei TaxID=33889 RepID=UPI003F81811D
MSTLEIPRVRGMRARRVLSQARFETVAVLRNGEQLLLALILPLGLLVFLTTTPLLEALGAIPAGGDRLSIALPGTLGLCLASTAFTGQAIATAFDRRYGVLAQLATTPLGTTGLILGKLGAVIVVVLIQYALAFAIACMFGFTGPVHVLPLIVATVLGTATLLALGLLMAGTLRAEATLGAANLVWVLMAGGGGLVLPGSGEWGTVVGYLPSGALGDALRASVGGGWDVKALIVLLVWGIVGALAARRWFRFE